MQTPIQIRQLELSNADNEPLKLKNIANLFDYDYENVLTKGNHQQRFQTRNRKITSDRIDYQLPDNSIQTAKYTLLNFFPKQLFIQFSKLANLYFLVIGIMQIIPQVSISNGLPVIFLPLSVIVFVSAMKDLYEDYKRHTSDQEENNGKVLTFVEGQFQHKLWKDVRVGHIIKVEQDSSFPADILLLRTSHPKGKCYVETKSLDGETNLKDKSVSSDLFKLYIDDIGFSALEKRIILKYEAPNPYLYRFYGEVINSVGHNSPISQNNFVLRGCMLRNIKYAIGLVAYTGHDTKIMMNSFKVRQKQSRLEMIMQKQIFYIFIVQMMICTFCAIYYVIWYKQSINDLEYMKIDLNGIVDNAPAYNFFIRIGNWILIFTNFVPISLLVTLEMVKFIQGFFIIHDSHMKKPSVQSSNLNEELGQIEYVFSDKTGTLTSNIMEFKQITIGQVSYGNVDPKESRYISDIGSYPKVTNVDFRDKQLFDEMTDESNPNHEQVMICLFFLATCHTIATDTKDGELVYNASSPDELALVNFARFCGVEYLGLDENNIITVKYKEKKFEFQQLEVFEFTSGRKRQSILLRFVKENEIWLYTKGADSVLLDPLRLCQKENDNKVKLNQMQKSLQQYGEIGLRTLVLCRRRIENKQFETWKKDYYQATTQLEGREEKMQVLQDDLETNFEIIGSTAIEDKLQNNVGSTIDAIKKAGIKVWVLTGDKIETAINIGYSCKLLQNSMKQHLVDEKEESMIRLCLSEILTELSNGVPQELNQLKGVMVPTALNGFHALTVGTNGIPTKTQNLQHALVISGDALFHALKPGISGMVMKIAEQCQVVLCCRVSPKQKQDVVSLVRKEKPGVTTLAIGDGANDVNMITAAHVGIGIRGVEGQQAARASDYAVAEFQDLRRLLFCHGRESYRRNSYLVFYNFFKNTLLVFPQFWFGTLSVFSGQSLYDSFLYQLFNILYASMPIIIYAVLDEEYSQDTLFDNKVNYYAQGMQNLLFNTKVFWLWVLNGVWQAAIICYFSIYSDSFNFISSKGYSSHLWANGTMVFGMVVVISNFKIAIFSNTFSIMTVVGLLGSLLTYLISWLIVDSISTAEAYQCFVQLWNTPNFHFGNILIIGTTTFIDISIEFYLRWSKSHCSESLAKSEDVQRKSLQKELTSKQPSFLGISKSLVPIKGHIHRAPTTHTGFAFCSLEREQLHEGPKFKQQHQF